MSWYEVMIEVDKGYRYIVEADTPDVAYDKAAERYDNDDDGDEGGYENAVGMNCTLIEKPEDNK